MQVGCCDPGQLCPTFAARSTYIGHRRNHYLPNITACSSFPLSPPLSRSCAVIASFLVPLPPHTNHDLPAYACLVPIPLSQSWLPIRPTMRTSCPRPPRATSSTSPNRAWLSTRTWVCVLTLSPHAVLKYPALCLLCVPLVTVIQRLRVAPSVETLPHPSSLPKLQSKPGPAFQGSPTDFVSITDLFSRVPPIGSSLGLLNIIAHPEPGDSSVCAMPSRLGSPWQCQSNASEALYQLILESQVAVDSWNGAASTHKTRAGGHHFWFIVRPASFCQGHPFPSRQYV